jgi:hypothetical protein
MNKLFFLTLVIFVFATGCKNTGSLTKISPSKMTSKQLQKNMEASAFEFDFFQAKAKVNYSDGKINQNFTANIRIQHNQKIWMSLTGPFGIEGARILITKSKIQIIDRLNGKYYDEPFEFINTYLPFQTDLAFIQNILVGNAFQKEWAKQKIDFTNELYFVEDEFSGIAAKYEVTSAYRYHRVQMNELNLNRSIKMNFEDYRFIEEQLFAMLRQIEFNDAGNIIRVELDFTKVKKEKELDFPFSVPDKMKN